MSHYLQSPGYASVSGIPLTQVNAGGSGNPNVIVENEDSGDASVAGMFLIFNYVRIQLPTRKRMY